MEIHLIDGQFSATDAIAIITQLTEVKIKYHENKIKSSHYEEDIKMREQKIKKLQKELADSRAHIRKQTNNITINSIINL
jgi:hypothetical protein